MNQTREHWGSKLGFILAASGSAVGIGNIWKYPHMAGQNGGAAFTLIYLICILVVGLSIVIGEFALGRKTQLSPVGAYLSIAPGSLWKWVGFLGVGSAFVILSFYGVVGGWIMNYSFLSLKGDFSQLAGNPEAASALFNSFITGTWAPLFWQLLFMMICIFVIVNGVKGGIEKWSRIMMPLIIILLAVIAIRGVTLDGGMAGISFLFKPRFEDLTASAIVLALGHAFFTLSLGMGTMITYGSYLKKNENLLNSALWVIGLDTFIALLAGVAIFTTVFALGANPAEGPGLIFVVLPSVFSQMDGGAIWGSLFFFLLFMAALTSGISILEVVTAYFIDQKNWSREKATVVFGTVISGVGIFCSLSNGGFTDFRDIFGISFMDFMDYLSSKYMLPIGGMLMAIFIIKRWTVDEFVKELHTGMNSTKISSQLVTILLSIGASIIGFIILNEIFDKLLGFPIIG